MKIAVLANGEWDAAWGREELAEIDWLICADGGGNHALASGRIPNVLIGDLDSVTAENLKICREKQVRIQQYPREKDETDLELALNDAVKFCDTLQPPKPSSIWLYGATGGRVDHLLGNLALLLRFLHKGYQIRMKDPHHELFLSSGLEVLPGYPGREMSLIPFTPSARVTTEGLYYPLKSDLLFQDSPRGISNVFLGENARIKVEEGIVLIALLGDLKKS